jgi:hypothetical protein
LGYRDAVDLRVRFQGLSPTRLEELAEQAVVPAPAAARALRDEFRSRSGEDAWYPWDFEFARRQEASLPDRLFPMRPMLPRILRAVSEWGFPTGSMRFRVTFHDLPMGGATIAPDPPKDVRILVHPQGGWPAYHVMFHEVGHAVQSVSVRAPRHLLRWHENVPGFGGFREGIGSLFEEIPRRVAWLTGRAGVERRVAERFAESRGRFDLFGAAFYASWIRREFALYRRPDSDVAADAARFDRRLFGYDTYRPRSFADPFFVDLPIYAPNYLIAILVHYQLTRALVDEFGEPLWPNRRVGPWLTREWFRSGSLYDWLPRMRATTGRPFGAESFRRACAAVDAAVA